VRILRVARFAARFGFRIADETLALMRTMVDNGEVDALVPERVWQELSRGLMEAKPSRMFDALRACGALARIMPELDALFGVPQPEQYHPEIDTGIHVMLVVDYAADKNFSLPVRFAALTHDLGKALTPGHVLPRHIGHEGAGIGPLRALCERLRVPTEHRLLAEAACREHLNVHRLDELRAATVHALIARCDGWRNPARIRQLAQVCEADKRGRAGHAEDAYPQAAALCRALDAALAVRSTNLAAGLNGPAIGEAMTKARIAAIAAATGKP
jgi:tRNA nucleotidyltransferase (CCA-adding enzyme)